MRKLIILSILIVAAIVSMAADRTGRIRTGYTMLTRPMVLDASDTTNTSETTTFTITNLQKYQQHQVFTVGLEDESGSPSVVITAYGKIASAGAWVQIGTPITWTSDSNDGDISSTTPINYNYLKVEFVASGATQQTSIDVFSIKTSNAYDIPANSGTLTVSRATSGTVTITSADDNANAALTIGAGGTGALTLGDVGSTTAITSSDWGISATGVMTGMGAYTTNGILTGTAGATISGAAINLNASSNFAVNVGTGSTTAAVTLGGGSNTVAINSSDWDIGTTGIMTGMGAATFDGVITATGGISLPTASTHIWPVGGSVVLVTAGTDAPATVGARYWTEMEVPSNVTLTGVSYLVGSVGGTDSVVVQLVNSAGTEVATSRAVGTAADLVGTAAQFHSVAFTTPYAAVAGVYYVVVQFNGTTAKFRTYPIPGSPFVAGTVAGSWDTAAGITPGTTFTADKGPIFITY